MLTHQVLSFPQASKLSSSASQVKYSSRMPPLAVFFWPRFSGHVSCICFGIGVYEKTNAGNVAIKTWPEKRSQSAIHHY